MSNPSRWLRFLPVAVALCGLAACLGPGTTAGVLYGDDLNQLGDLYIPTEGSGPFPVVVLIHGGSWSVETNRLGMHSTALELQAQGFAVWNLEYRRHPHPGAAWPGLFADIDDGIDHLQSLAQLHPLDLDRVAVMGFSAGGHLALWAAGRDTLPASMPGSGPTVRVRVAVGIAPVTDLADPAIQSSLGIAVRDLMGGTAEELPARYALASPAERPAPTVPLLLVHGVNDYVVPVAQSVRYTDTVRAKGGDVTLLLSDSDHYTTGMADPSTWPTVLQWLRIRLS